MQEPDEREGTWRKILLSGGAILGAAAAYNAFARKGVDQLTNLIGGEEGGFEWRDRRIAFTKHGEGPPVLLIHGIHAAAWSYEWRNNVDALARTNTVYTIDLLGFGRSDRPAIRYSARLYISLISDFVSRVIDAPTVLVASSLSGAYAIVLAARDPQRFPAVALIAPSGLVRLNEPVGIGGEAGRLAVDTPIAGTAMFNALVSRPNLRRYLRNAYSDDSLVTASWSRSITRRRISAALATPRRVPLGPSQHRCATCAASPESARAAGVGRAGIHRTGRGIPRLPRAQTRPRNLSSVSCWRPSARRASRGL